MEYLCLVLQILFLLATVYLLTGETYLYHYGILYKKYLYIDLVVQVLCIIINLVCFFQQSEIMVYILALQIMVSGLIKAIFSYKAQRMVLNELKERIINQNIMHLSSVEIRRVLLEKYEKAYFIQDIEKCLSENQKRF